jgi:hypothetical protein
MKCLQWISGATAVLGGWAATAPTRPMAVNPNATDDRHVIPGFMAGSFEM